MHQKSVIKNYLYNLIYQVIVTILPLITTPYISRILGAEGVGIGNYTISVVTYFILMGSLGIGMYTQREIAYIRDNKEKRSKIFFEVLLLRAITLIISMIIFYFIFVKNVQYGIYYKILLVEIITAIIDITTFFYGMEEFKKIVERNLLVRLIGIIFTFIFVKQPSDLYKYLIIQVLSNFIGNISLWFYIPKYIEKVSIKTLNIYKHFKPTIVLFIPQLATQIYTVFDRTLLGAMVLDKAEVGYYSQSQKIIQIILTVITSLGNVLLPRVANDFANGKKEEIKKYIMTSFNFVYFLSIPMIFGLIAISNDFIPFFLGEEFEKSIYITYIISPLILIIGLGSVTGTQYLLPTKKQKEFTISVLCGAILNLLLNLILIPTLFSIATAVSILLTEMLVTVIQLYFIRKEFEIKKILKISFKYIIASIIMYLIIVFVNNMFLLYFSPIIRIIIDILFGMVIYIILLFIMKDKFIKKCLGLILKRKNSRV